MIELLDNSLVISFPEVHDSAVLRIDFQRTLRIPDDGNTYYLPPGLGEFPLHHVDDYSGRVPAEWSEHGGVMFPMYQSEAMWINFRPNYNLERDIHYPFAVKIATGKVNTLSGEEWSEWLHCRPQNYVVVPEQPWLDGYCVKEGVIRQFVAMPLGSSYSAEEQITGKAENGGLQLEVYPMKKDIFEKRFPPREKALHFYLAEPKRCYSAEEDSMSFAPGGQMGQHVYKDPYELADWDDNHTSRCFVHIANSLLWREYTGENPPTAPPTSEEYTRAGLPWFEWYDDDNQALASTQKLSGLKSVKQIGNENGKKPLPENKTVKPDHVIKLRKGLKQGQVREWPE